MKHVTVIVLESEVKNLEVIAKKLSDLGFIITSKQEYGVITGDIDEPNIKLIKQLREIESIVEEQRFNILPPESDIQ